jgi:hypothetical protein
MALELTFWLIITIIGLGGYIFSLMYQKHFLLILSCALLIGSGALLWGFNGLILDHQPTSFPEIDGITTIVYTDIIVDMTNIGLSILALIFIVVGVLSILVINFNTNTIERRGTFHY